MDQATMPRPFQVWVPTSSSWAVTHTSYPPKALGSVPSLSDSEGAMACPGLTTKESLLGAALPSRAAGVEGVGLQHQEGKGNVSITWALWGLSSDSL